MTDQGLHYKYNNSVEEKETIESLKEKLAKANQKIQRLEEALGANHPLGMKKGIRGLF